MREIGEFAGEKERPVLSDRMIEGLGYAGMQLSLPDTDLPPTTDARTLTLGAGGDPNSDGNVVWRIRE